jgi:BirA family biotin operon repressor/biotin-[acetyl-CoA-carboxylase] ligase
MSEESHAIPADLGPDLIGAALGSRRYGRSLEVKATTGSTNDDARLALEAGRPDGHVIVADHQSSGRGARGRRWESPAGSDLYFSIAARIPLEPRRLPPVTLAVGLGVARALESLGVEAVELKWPNDVWVAKRKCAGILVEAGTRGATLDGVVIGIGIDVNRQRFDDELADVATSLRLATSRRHARGAVLATVLEAVETEVDRLVRFGPDSVLREVDRRLAMRGEVVACDEVEGTLLGLGSSGAIRIGTATGVRELLAGTLRPRR